MGLSRAQLLQSAVPGANKIFAGFFGWLQLDLQPSGVFAFISGIRFLCNVPNNC